MTHIQLMKKIREQLKRLPDWHFVPLYWSVACSTGLSPQSVAELTGVDPDEQKRQLREENLTFLFQYCNQIDGPIYRPEYRTGGVGWFYNMVQRNLSPEGYYPLKDLLSDQHELGAQPPMSRSHWWVESKHLQRLAQFPWPEWKGYKSGEAHKDLRLGGNEERMRTFCRRSRIAKEAHFIFGSKQALRAMYMERYE